ncbi:protein WIR1A-like [Triticum dicoccoides]|uniref:protein WIR1A-like n=1 Tax=Triticum dicoccoides TaxID=85692 RepID=UPI001891BD4C|nr:protein WIR1A-like [Triticum dicoccoides]
MGSFARAARFLVLLQIVLFVISAVLMSGPVCHGARPGIGGGALDPNRPTVTVPPGDPYTGRRCSSLYRCPPSVQP